MNLITKNTDTAMYVTLAYVSEGDFVIDATCGNGYDTAALSEAVGERGLVISFDIQQRAIDNARRMMEKDGRRNVILIKDSFESMGEVIGNFTGKRPSAIVFNLGYLPHGDKSVTTNVKATMRGVAEALEIIKTNGIVTVTMYPGHEEGRREKQALLEAAKKLPADRYHALHSVVLNGERRSRKSPPEILFITKKSDK